MEGKTVRWINELNKIIMKINTSQEKQRRIQHLNAPKTSFLSMSPRNDNIVKNLLPKNTVKRYDTVESSDTNKGNKQKNVEDQGFTNIFADDSQSTKHYSKRENYLSSENLRASFKGKQNIAKNNRQSENIHQNDSKTPPNSLCDKKIVITKSASNLTKPNPEFLYIKSDNMFRESEKDEDTTQIKQLLAQIQQVKAFNEKIESQNIQLRLEKLYYNSESREIISLRKEINQMKRKIEKIKAQNIKTDQQYYQYYPGRKEQRKIPGHVPFYQKQRVNQVMPRTSSNLQAQYPPVAINSYEISQNAYQPLSTILTKSRVQEKSKVRKVNDDKTYMGQSTYKIHEDKDPNIIRIEIRK